MGFNKSVGLIVASCLIGLVWALINWYFVQRVRLPTSNEETHTEGNEAHKLRVVEELGDKIAKGAHIFLMEEYKFCLGFIAFMTIVLWLAVDRIDKGYTAIAFLIGGLTSILCGYIAMWIATRANFRTTYSAKQGLEVAFRVAFQAGLAMGFTLGNKLSPKKNFYFFSATTSLLFDYVKII
jgi:Na+/H+-translocating membrane pyrophosphatase